jgi:hypothetical protein
VTKESTRLLGLEDVEVVSCVLDEHENPMLALVTAAETARRPPGCGQISRHLRARAAATRRARGHLTTHTSVPHSQPRHPKAQQHD